MTSDELAQGVERTIEACVSRIKGTGNEQYARGNEQRFEQYDMPTLVQQTREEVLDIINYAVMLDIRMQWLEKAWKEYSYDGDDC